MPAKVSTLSLSIAFLLTISCAEGEWSGFVAGEARMFPDNPQDERQHHSNLSLSFSPEYYVALKKDRGSFTFRPFLRLDQHDRERTHLDLREMYWQKAEEKWEVRLGIRKVFWGVTESQHLVDIINQTDAVENPDGEDKLGQPMINLALVRNWGTIELFLLSGFRKRTFSGVNGRLRPPLPIDTGDAEFESSAAEMHIDWALRWSHSRGDWDFGLSHFVGTGREPRFRVRYAGLRPSKLVPIYDQINQSGLDLQLTKGSWLWKLEAIHRSGQANTFTAFTGGFEYTKYGVFGTRTDLGILLEYLYDSRGDRSPGPFEDDLFAGVRLGVNDKQSTELLAGAITDADSGATVAFLEASRRLVKNWKLNVEARFFLGFPDSDPGFVFRKDDYLQVELVRYF